MTKDDVKVDLIQKRDVPQLVKLLGEMEVPIAGCPSKRLYSIFCREAFANRDLVIVTAKTGSGRVVGFNISIINRRRFWMIFALKHPIATFQILLKKYSDKVRIKRNGGHATESVHDDIKKYLSTDSNSVRWQDSGKEIAKIIYTGVHPDFRNRHVGTHIARYRNRVLLAKGVKRLDGTVSPKNIASIKLNHRLGVTIVPHKRYLLTCKFLDDSTSSQ
jgi:RimJ/RimL family protein N-acetyltransferase